MRESKETKFPMEAENRTSEQLEGKPGTEGLSRRAFLGVGSAGLASAALASLAVNAQDRADTEKQNKIILQVIRARKTSPFWMKIRIQIFLRRPITATSSRYGTPSISLPNALKRAGGQTK